MWPIETNFRVRLGSTLFYNLDSIIRYKGTDIFTARRRERDGRLSIDFDIHDPTGARVGLVRAGTMISGDPEKYTITSPDFHYTLTEKESGRVLCDVRKGGPDDGWEVGIYCDLYMFDGVRILASPDGIFAPGMTIVGGMISDSRVGIGIK